MRAIHCEKLGGPEDLVLTEADDPQPAPGEVLIEVRAAELIRADVQWRHYRLWELRVRDCSVPLGSAVD